jgi:hypothetical protein
VCTLDAVNIFSEFIDMPFLLISLVR